MGRISAGALRGRFAAGRVAAGAAGVAAVVGVAVMSAGGARAQTRGGQGGAAGAGAAAPVASASPVAPLPPKARPLADAGRYASPFGFRDTIEWYKKELRRRGVNVTIDGPIRVRETTYVRILPKDTGLPWSAVHILLAEGRTSIYLVAAFEGPAPSKAF